MLQTSQVNRSLHSSPSQLGYIAVFLQLFMQASLHFDPGIGVSSELQEVTHFPLGIEYKSPAAHLSH